MAQYISFRGSMAQVPANCEDAPIEKQRCRPTIVPTRGTHGRRPPIVRRIIGARLAWAGRVGIGHHTSTSPFGSVLAMGAFNADIGAVLRQAVRAGLRMAAPSPSDAAPGNPIASTDPAESSVAA